MISPRVSIVIVAWGRREITARCLDSLGNCLGDRLGAEIELVLVDNHSPDDTLELFNAWRDRAVVVPLPENRNFAGGCNAGAAAARGDVLIFLNNDTIVEPGMLEALADQAQAPGISAAGLRLLYLDGTLQHAGVAMIRVPGGPPVPHHLFHHQPGNLPAARISYELDVVTAACLAVRRSAFDAVGGYDPGYVNGWEDVDLCLRLRMAGHRIVYRGDLWLWHDEGRTRGTVRGVDPNAARFYQRWGTVLDSDEELVGRVFGGRLPELGPLVAPAEPARVLIEGPITGLTAAAAEARGLLRACAAGGIPAAAREPCAEMVWAQLHPAEHAAVRAALVRPVHPAALRLIPGDARLVPCVATGPPGPGGLGILCQLPGHDLTAAEAAVDALEQVGPARVRVLPTAASLPLLRLVQERLPDAELLAPAASEERLRDLASEADIFLPADPHDTLERSSLIAAGAGAAPVVVAGGRAHRLLGGAATVYPEFTAVHLAGALRDVAPADPADRRQRAAVVAAAGEVRTAAATLVRRLAEAAAQAA